MTSSAPPVVIRGSGNNIIVNPSQKENRAREHIKNVGQEFGDIVADYQVGKTTGVLFLSLKYHSLRPDYILTRIEKLGRNYDLRILLVLCDVTEHRRAIRELTKPRPKTCLTSNITIVVAFSYEEVGHYLATFKLSEFKSPALIKERVDPDYNSIFRTALTSINKVNKTNAETLRTSLGSFANIAKATPDQLQALPDLGQVKVKNIKHAFEAPFRNEATTKLAELQSKPAKSSDAPSTSATNPPQKQQVAGPSKVGAGQGRPESPVWDIEVDEALPEDDGRTSTAQPVGTFDIELDLS